MIKSKYDLPLEKRLLGPILAEKARTEGGRIYLRHEDRSFSFEETDRIVRELAGGMAFAGTRKSDNVAIFLPNGIEFVLAWYACCLLGSAMVPINTAHKGQLLDYILNDCCARGLFIDRGGLEVLATASPEVLRSLEWVAVVGGTDGVDLPRGPKLYVDFDELRGAPKSDDAVTINFSDVHCIMYTSGTTGPSKGVIIPNGHFFSSAITFLKSVGLERDDILFTPLPLFHGLASRLGILPALMVGAEAVIANRFSATEFWRQVTESNATVAHTIFTIPPILKSRMPGPYDRAHRLRAMYNATYDPEFEERFGVRLVEAYGLTETGLTIYTPYPERRLGSCGRTHEDFEIMLADERDRQVAHGEPGQILVRPKLPSIMMDGYLNKPEETLRTMRGLWFHTGDFARQDEDGFFYFVGRKAERIRRRGENISAWEIEKITNGHPAVSECAAVAHPAQAGEDDVRVVIVLRPGNKCTPQEVMDWLVPRMPKFMLPRYIEFADALPRTPTNKVEKFRLVEDGLSTSVWDREAENYDLGAAG